LKKDGREAGVERIDREAWMKAFKAFEEGKTPLDLVVEGVLVPDEAELAYRRYLEMVRKYGGRAEGRAEGASANLRGAKGGPDLHSSPLHIGGFRVSSRRHPHPPGDVDGRG